MYAVLIGSCNDMMIGNRYGIHTATRCLEAVYDLHRCQIPYLKIIIQDKYYMTKDGLKNSPSFI